jgi:hypothetical protein
VRRHLRAQCSGSFGPTAGGSSPGSSTSHATSLISGPSGATALDQLDGVRTPGRSIAYMGWPRSMWRWLIRLKEKLDSGDGSDSGTEPSPKCFFSLGALCIDPGIELRWSKSGYRCRVWFHVNNMVNSDHWDLMGAVERGDTWRDPGVRTFIVDGPDHGSGA